jgi:hypothetical protein
MVMTDNTKTWSGSYRIRDVTVSVTKTRNRINSVAADKECVSGLCKIAAPSL